MTDSPESPEPSGIARPTNAELDVLRELWALGPATVRDVHARLSANKPLAYTTTLKTLQVMAEKGLVTRDESQRSHVYAAAVPQEQTQQKLVGDLLSRAFGNSLGTFVMQALSARRATADELAEVRKLVEEYERSLR
jgi:BlaI family transcriptional regulator, penicillinase repressor